MYRNYGTVIPAAYKPISAWGYFGYRILYSIPLIGWIFLFIHAFGASNVNVRRHARSYFCTLLLVLVLVGVLVALILISGIFNNVNFEALEKVLKDLIDVFTKA